MHGLMMTSPLTTTSIMRHAEMNHGNREIVSVTADNPRHRYTVSDCFKRTRQLANVLSKFNLPESTRVGTLAWNDYRHLELYYAISSMGLVCHTINPRLFEEQLTFIINHAEDQLLFVDVVFVSMLEKIHSEIPNVLKMVVLTDRANMPESSLDLLCYEELLADEPDAFDWPDLDENLASTLCYTSGTTGNPKGVLYSHRSNVLHAYASLSPDVLSLASRDVILPVVPMFHVSAWGTPYSAMMAGAKLVFPGPKMADGEVLTDLMNSEGVTVSLGVPTVWLALLSYLNETTQALTTLQRTVVGGAACPQSIMDEFRDKHNVITHHGWGMTEMSPIGTINTPKLAGSNEEWVQGNLRLKQGRPPYGVELKIVDDSNNELPRDGVAFGALKVRGPWICNGYFQLPEKRDDFDEDGWFDTGDVATIDPEGYLQITDRTKDVIKSGGEWISSIDLENAAVTHEGVQEAAVIGRHHPKWDERPLLIVVRAKDNEVSKDEILQHLVGKVAKWWLPDDVVFVDEIPHTATGKISKLKLREQFDDYKFSE